MEDHKFEILTCLPCVRTSQRSDVAASLLGYEHLSRGAWRKSAGLGTRLEDVDPERIEMGESLFQVIASCH